MESLISGDVLKPISDLGIVLLNKVEKATGWIFSTTTAKKEGYKNIIEEISKRDDINPIDRTVIISNFRKIKREHKNKTQIVDKAISLLEKGDNPEKLDNDWVLRFFEFCKAVSNEDLQYVWAKILANECKENSNNSFKLLNTISEISNNEINLIRKILKECNYGIRNFEAIGIIFIKNEYLEDIDIKYDESGNFNQNGLDDIEFLIATNVGDEAKPLIKIASGGEMSRIMLAIKTVLSDVDKIPVLVFDEIDTGISGKAAKAVGEKMKLISKKHQVICITHLATIAAKGDSNYYVSKNVVKQATVTDIRKLKENEIIEEIAKMTNGEVTETSKKHAMELRLANVG